MDQIGSNMKLHELRAKIPFENFPSDAFSIDGSTPKYNDGTFVLSRENGVRTITMATWVYRSAISIKQQLFFCDN